MPAVVYPKKGFKEKKRGCHFGKPLAGGGGKERNRTGPALFPIINSGRPFWQSLMLLQNSLLLSLLVMQEELQLCSGSLNQKFESLSLSQGHFSTFLETW